MDRRVPGADVDIVRCSSTQGAYDLVTHLLAQGHRRITMLSGPADVSTAHERVAGCRQAVSTLALSAATLTVLEGEFTVESGYAMAYQAMAQTPRPTAIFAANNFIAIGALKALSALGVRVPEDVGVVGFDDLPAALVVDPFLTVVAQPAYEMGRRATELLLQRIADPAALPQEVLLPTQLIIRQSCRAV